MKKQLIIAALFGLTSAAAFAQSSAPVATDAMAASTPMAASTATGKHHRKHHMKKHHLEGPSHTTKAGAAAASPSSAPKP